MTVKEFVNLEREDVQIFYIRKYSAVAVIELPLRTDNVNIKFSIEMNSFGQKDISLVMENQIDYPMIPLKKAITEFILKLEQEGKLPC